MKHLMLVAVVGLIVLVAGCDGDGIVASQTTGQTVSGSVIAGPVDGATVNVWEALNTGAPGALLGTATTASDGTYSLFIDYVGAVVVSAGNGTFIDEATGDQLALPPDDALAAVAVLTGDDVTIHVTPLTTLAKTRAAFLAQHPDMDAVTAIRNANLMVEDYFGFRGITGILPADLTAEQNVAGGTARAEYGAAIAGLSHLAWKVDAGPIDLINDLAKDGIDGVFEGRAFGDEIGHDPFSGGRELADAIDEFLDTNTRNVSGLESGDVSAPDTMMVHVVEMLGADPITGYPALARVDQVDETSQVLSPTNSILIRGEFFDDNVRVWCGSTQANLLSTSSTELTVELPPASAPDAIPIEVHNPVTVEGTTSYLVTPVVDAMDCYQPGLAPVPGSLCPSVGPTIGGALVAVRGASFDDSATVRFGGVDADIVYRHLPDLIVVRAPAHAAGTVSVDVLGDGGTGTLPSAFQYRDHDVAPMHGNSSVTGDWHLYSMRHQIHRGEASSFSGLSIGLSFDGAGSVTADGIEHETSTQDESGSDFTIFDTLGYVVFPDGELWLDPGEGDYIRGWITDTADVFISGIVEHEDANEFMVGVRKGTGKSTASLNGTWWFAFMAHRFVPGDRIWTTSLGSAEFDGQGSGSLSYLSGTIQQGHEYRGLDVAPFTYSVTPDGTVTLNIPEEGPVICHLSQRNDLLVGGWGDGEVGMFLCIPCDHALAVGNTLGSWYGGGLGYQETEGGPTYESFRFRSINDVNDTSLVDLLSRFSSDDYDEVKQEVWADNNAVAPTGTFRNSEADLVFGAVGAFGRFRILLPSDQRGGTQSSSFDYRFGGLVMRRCSYYSKASIANQLNWVAMGKEYQVSGDPPQDYAEGIFTSRGTLNLDHATGFDLDGILHGETGTLAHPYGGGVYSYIWREDNGNYVQMNEGTQAQLSGAYAIAGDGKLYAFIREHATVPTLANGGEPGGGPGEARVQPLVGDVTPHGELAVLHSTADPYWPHVYMILLRNAPSHAAVDGIYDMAEFGLGIKFETEDRPLPTFAMAGIGGPEFNDGTTYIYRSDYRIEWEFGDRETDSADIELGFSQNGAWLDVDGEPGICTPDASLVAILLQDNWGEEFNIAILVRRPATALPAPTGQWYRYRQQSHEYGSLGPYATPAQVGLSSGQLRMGASSGDVSYVYANRYNYRWDMTLGQGFTAPFGFTQDHNQFWDDTRVNVFSDNYRYGFHVDTDGYGYPAHASGLLWFRR